MTQKNQLLLLFIIALISCSSIKNNYATNSKLIKKEVILNDQFNNWQNKDITLDTIAGVSLDRACHDLLKGKKGKSVIVAVLDTELDIDHEDLKDAIWINKKEIPNNSIDDDHNGYVDDVNGWNFLSNARGEAIINQNMACTRIIRKFKKQFEKNGGNESFYGNKKDSLLYDKALEIYKQELGTISRRKKTAVFYIEGYPRSLNTVRKFFPNGKYSYKQIDSLFKVYENDKNRQLGDDIYFMRDVMKFSLNQQYFDDYKKKVDDEFNTTFNDSYFEKAITGDDEENINDTHYGSNNVYKNAKWVYHATQVSGLIAAIRDNNKGIQGFSNNIKIMPVCVIANGGADHDKDQALAIRYAVDNGAKIINMSFIKSMSVHPEWLKEAMLYAEKKDVLLIGGAGNDAESIDIVSNYPLDYNEDTGKEFCSNFISVGATTSIPNENFLASFTDYGKKNVDIFAPGQDIYTTDATRGYVRNRGTSLACAITSGTAALIRSYYPKLTAPQVKQIILDSGVSYDIEVIVPGTKDKKVKFSELSKSGKVVNVYNAMIMAGEIAKRH